MGLLPAGYRMGGTGGHSRVANPHSVVERTYENRFIIHEDGLCWGTELSVCFNMKKHDKS